jgi:hypothetical protein
MQKKTIILHTFGIINSYSIPNVLNNGTASGRTDVHGYSPLLCLCFACPREGLRHLDVARPRLRFASHTGACVARHAGTARVPSHFHAHPICNTWSTLKHLMQYLQHTKGDRLNTWNMRAETLTKICKKSWKTIATYKQHSDKTFTTYIWNICNIQINALATYVWKTNETLGTDARNVRVQTIAT